MGSHRDDTDADPTGLSEGIASDHQAYLDLVPEPAARGLASSWLYRTSDGVFGPVSAQELLELLYTESISEDTLVSPDEAGEFREIRRYGVFKPHVDRVQEQRKRRADLEARAQEAQRIRRAWRLRWATRVVAGVALSSVLLYGCIRGLRIAMAAVEQAQKQRVLEAEMARMLAEVRIEPPSMPQLPVEPSATRAQASSGEAPSAPETAAQSNARPASAPEVAQPGAAALNRISGTKLAMRTDTGRRAPTRAIRSPPSKDRSSGQARTGKIKRRSSPKGARVAPVRSSRKAKSPPRRSLRPRSTGTKAKRNGGPGRRSGRGRLSDDEVMSGMNRAFPAIVRCIRGQLRRNATSVPGKVVLRFSISNKGRATRVRLADRFLRRSPLQGCVQRQMKSVQWRPFKGQVRNIEYPISVRKPR